MFMVVCLYAHKKKEAGVGKCWIDMNTYRNPITIKLDSCGFV